MNDQVLLEDVAFSYREGKQVLSIPRFHVAAGERLFLHGPSGSGKTTLLGLIAGVLKPQKGRVSVLGNELERLSASARDKLRGEKMGYIFQSFNLIPYLSVEGNISLPCQLHPARLKNLGHVGLAAAVKAISHRLDIDGILADRVNALSVGQQQRVAAARALIGAPQLLIADEPTSSLDHDRRERFIKLLFDTCSEFGTTLIFVSHDPTLMPLFDRHVFLADINGAQA